MTQPRALARTRQLLLAVVVALATLLVPAGAAQGADGGPALTVMTRNLYLGSGLDALVTAPDQGAFVAAVGQTWANVVATDFPARAEALAAEVRATRPDVIGLQEVSLWREQPVGDIVLGETDPNAEDVVYDFLAILQAELGERGQSYVAVSTSVNADVEAPRANALSPTQTTDVRLTDRDVILVRAPLARKFGNPQDGHYDMQLSLPTAAGPVTFTRGWASIDYRHDARRTVRIFDTHLEVGAPLPAALAQQAQGLEFLDLVAQSPFPVVALGDFNSAADGSTTPTYGLLTGALTDAWTTARPGDPGLTCCQSELLDDPVPAATSRIDLILTTGAWPADRAARTGTTPFRACPAPLWASDHYGVVTRLQLPR